MCFETECIMTLQDL